MSIELVQFGQLSRMYRHQKKLRLADQAKALSTTLPEISNYEVGTAHPSISYIKRLAEWLKLDTSQETQLIMSAQRNNKVVSLEDHRKKFKDGRKFFRKVHKLTPKEIKGLRQKLEVPDE